MADNKTLKEHRVLVRAATEFAKTGQITVKCPRCSSCIVIDTHGTSYTVHCKNKDCISASFRGI